MSNPPNIIVNVKSDENNPQNTNKQSIKLSELRFQLHWVLCKQKVLHINIDTEVIASW